MTIFSKKIVVVAIMVEIGLFLLFLGWLGPLVALKVALSFPFLFVFPGYFALKIFYTDNLDLIEKTTASVVFSMTVIFLSIFLVEEYSERLTPMNVTLTVIIINILLSVLKRSKQWFISLLTKPMHK